MKKSGFLKRLRIRGFRSHKDTQIEFHPGVNVILGDPQSGKTNIIQALLWLARNRPKGYKFHSYFTDSSTRVSLSLEDHVVSLEKSGESSASYRLDKERFKTVGFSVPDKITNLLNLGDLGIQKQLDPPFLITSSSGKVARAINEATKLEPVDGWASELTRRKNRADHEAVLLKKEVKEIKVSLKRYSTLDKTEKAISELEDLDRGLKGSQKQFFTLDRELVAIEVAEKAINGLKKFLSAEKYVVRAEEVDEEIELLVDEERLLCRVVDIDKKLLILMEVFGGLKELISVVEVEEERDRLLDVVHRIETIGGEMTTWLYDLKVCRSEYISELERAGKCPVCFSLIDSGVIKRIGREL